MSNKFKKFKDLATGKTLERVNDLGYEVKDRIHRYGGNPFLSYNWPKFTGKPKNPKFKSDEKWFRESKHSIDRGRYRQLGRLYDKTKREQTKAQAAAATGIATLGGGLAYAISDNTSDSSIQNSLEKNANVSKFFKRIGDLYKGTTSKNLATKKEIARKHLNSASTDKTVSQSVVDKLNERFNDARIKHFKEQSKRGLLYGMTGVAGVSAYKKSKGNE